MLIEYVGIACASVLIRISHLAFEMNFSFHPITFLVIFSCKFLKVLTFDLPLAIGRPRYLSQCVITLAPNNCCIACLVSGLVFLLKNKEVFCLLICWLDASSYYPNTCNNLRHSPTAAWQNKMLSSAKRRWEMLTPCWLDWIPFSTLCSSAFLNRIDKFSTHKRKMYGDRGSPCLIPLEGVMKPFGSPLISTD